MKKFIKITGIVIAIIFALLIILPIAFKGKIEEQVKVLINENINAKVDFDSFHLSFIRSFPDVNLRIKGLTIDNNEPFAGVRLADIKTISVSVNLMSFIRGDGYEIKSIHLEKPEIHVIVLDDGSANWDIEIKTEEIEEIEPEEKEPSTFKLALKKITLNNSYIVYDDKDFDVYLRMDNSNVNLSGDLTASTTNVIIRKTDAERMYLNVEGIPLLGGVFFDMTANVAADLDNFIFTFLDNRFQFNDLIFNIAGDIEVPSADVIMNITFDTPQTDFKAFLSLIPGIYAKDFEDVQTSGTLGFSGYAKGLLNADNVPGFDINILVEDGMFQYPDLPAAVKDININAKLFNPGGSADYSIVDVSKFHVDLAGNPVDFKLNLRTPLSDPQIEAYLKGQLDLSKVKDFYPLEVGESLSGLIESDLEAKGNMSSIEKERYNEFVFTGKFIIKNMNYISKDFPEGVKIREMDFRFSPRFVELRSFISTIGESDFAATGRIDNLLGFALNDEMLTGNFTTNSRFFNLNQFISESDKVVADKETQVPDEPVELSVIEIPENINFTLRSIFDKLIFDNIEITNVNGTIRVVDQAVRMQNLRMNLLDGSMVLNGSYSTKQFLGPEIDFDMDINRFDIQKTFNTFNTFAKIAPIGERANGKFSAKMTMKSLLNNNLNPDLNSLSGSGIFNSENVIITNSPSLVSIANQLKMEQFKNLEVRDVSVKFKFNDGQLEVDPFDIKFGNSTANISGSNSFDQSINYLAKFAIPRSEFGGAANEALNAMITKASVAGVSLTPGETVFVGAAITGTVTEPRISLSLAESTADIKEQVKDQIKDKIEDVKEDVKEKAQEKIDDTKEKAQEELEKRAQQVIREAERQADNIRKESTAAAQKLRSEARTNAKKLEDEASGAIAKAAARRTGQEMIATADRNAKKLEDDADARAKQIVSEANKRADKIRAGKE